MDIQSVDASELKQGDTLLGYGRVKRVTLERGRVHVCTPVTCLLFALDDSVTLVRP